VQIGKILVPVDFSESSARALDEAIGLAREFGAELIVFHCYELSLPPFGRGAYDLAPPESYVESIRAAALETTRLWADKARARKVRAQERIGAGLPASEIVSLAQELGADLIVMGTRGRSGLEHVLLGSVAERTIRFAPCPVLTVKAEQAETREH
jgi:universal stress protein A